MTCIDGFDSIVRYYYERAEEWRCNKGIAGVSSLLSWDATLLPIRGNSIDVIISDLPFGVRCMSSKKLKSFLPLLLAECARCLRAKTGKLTLLCGSYQTVFEGLNQVNTEYPLFENPQSLIPINIGGLSAWIVQVKRSNNIALRFKNHRQRSAKITKGRNQSKGSKRLQA